MKTFADLGIPFPLYEAPIETCRDYVGRGHCCITGKVKEHCFRIDIGAWIELRCEGCGKATVWWPTDDDLPDEKCRHCGTAAPPPVLDGPEVLVCYEALRGGFAGFTKDGDYGMISWEQLESGWTHGIPGGKFPGMETRSSQSGSEWVQVRLPKETLSELTRTPGFRSWQGDRWRFRGAEPMIYVGEWKKRDFKKHAPSGVGEEFFNLVMRRSEASGLWASADDVCIYVFRDGATGEYEAYYDTD